MSRFPFSKVRGAPEKSATMPFVPLRLYYAIDEVHVTEPIIVPALVDSGSAVNVLPRDVGEQFNLNWNEQQNVLPPAGIVRGFPALALSVFVKIPGIAPQELMFAWSELPSNKIRTLLGQVDFFDEFFVDFRKPRGYFEIVVKDE
jgi:hypothetical protein